MSEKTQLDIEYEKYINEWSPERGFTKEEKQEYDNIRFYCWMFETDDNVEYQQKVCDLIEMIIKNDHLDYISKLDKIHTIVGTNKSFNHFQKRRWDNARPIGDKLVIDQ